MENIDKFINEIVKCIDDNNNHNISKKNILDYLTKHGIHVKGNYFNIKINESTRGRGRPRKELKLNSEDINNNNNDDERNTNKKNYKLLRKVEEDVYEGQNGKRYSLKGSNELVELEEDNYV